MSQTTSSGRIHFASRCSIHEPLAKDLPGALALLLLELALAVLCRVRVDPEQDLSVLERVLLLHARALGRGHALLRPQHGLDLRRVDEPADVGVQHKVRRRQEVALHRGWRCHQAVELVKRGKGR